MPSARITRRCQRDQPSASSRDGTSDSIQLPAGISGVMSATILLTMTKLDFGAFVLGGNVFGWTVQREEAFHLLDAFLDHGGRMIDTVGLVSTGR